MSKSHIEKTKKPVITKNFKDGAIIASIAVSVITFIITAAVFNQTLFVATCVSGLLIAIIFLVIGIWKKRFWAIIASLSIIYTLAILAFSVLGNWPGYLDMVMTGFITAICLILTTIFVSVVFAHKTWKKISKPDKVAIVLPYIAPIIILAGGYYCGLAMNLRLARTNPFSSEMGAITSNEILYSNIGSTTIGIGIAIFLITNLMLIYAILMMKKTTK